MWDWRKIFPQSVESCQVAICFSSSSTGVVNAETSSWRKHDFFSLYYQHYFPIMLLLTAVWAWRGKTKESLETLSCLTAVSTPTGTAWYLLWVVPSAGSQNQRPSPPSSLGARSRRRRPATCWLSPAACSYTCSRFPELNLALQLFLTGWVVGARWPVQCLLACFIQPLPGH